MSLMSIWTVTLTRGKVAIVIEGEGENPHIPDRIGSDICGSHGPIYQELRERIVRGPWSWLQDRMRDENDLYWIDHAARETALQYPGWMVESNLPPLNEPEDVPEGAIV